MECEAAASEVVVKVAWPELRLPVPRVVAPSLKVTVPVGVPAPGATALTVAVNVTGWPNTVGVAEEMTDVDELALLTVWVNGAAVLLLPLKLPSPLYTAVTL